MAHVHDFGQMPLEKAQRVGHGHHDPGGLVVEDGGQGGRIDDAVLGLDSDHLETGDGGRGRIGAMGRIRADDLGLLVALVGMVGGDDKRPGQFAVGAGHGMQGEGGHARHFTEQPLHLVEDLQGPGGHVAAARELGGQGMEPRKSRQGGHFLGELGVVLHGARPQGIEVAVHAVIFCRQRGEMAHHVELGQRRQIGRRAAQELLGNEIHGLGFGALRPHPFPTGHGFGKDGAHRIRSSRRARRSISARSCFSVQQTSKAFSRPL